MSSDDDRPRRDDDRSADQAERMMRLALGGDTSSSQGAESAAPKSVEPGDTLGSYEIRELIGAGGMGRVFLARDTRLKRLVALKVLSDELATNPVQLQRWQREAETVAALNHPNIVTIFSVEEHGATRFFTMELVEGKTLGAIIPQGGLELGRFFEIAIPLTDALAAAHGRGVAHRDLKPSNIMVSKDGWIKVLDFGLAKLFDTAGERDRIERSTDTLTRSGLAIGTLPYMSPEQVLGGDVDLRTDIFSLGIVLYEMMAGRRPFRSEDSTSLASAIVLDEPKPVSAVRTELPPALESLIHRCLQKEPERRYQSAPEVRDDLGDLRREIESGYVSAGRPTRRSVTAPGPWTDRIGVYALRCLWTLLLPVIVLGGLFGKLVVWGLSRELDLQVIDSAQLTQRPLFWAGAFLEQSLDGILAAGGLGWGGLVAGLALILNLVVLFARPPDAPPSGGGRSDRLLRQYSRFYHFVILPVLIAAAARIFVSQSGSLIWMAAFGLLLFGYLAYLIAYSRDLVSGSLGERFSYLVVGFFFLALVLFLPYNYGRNCFDLDQPPLVERAQRLGAASDESFERSGEMTVVVDSDDRILASIQLSEDGKLVSLLEVESFQPRPQPKSLRDLVTSIEVAELHDATAIAGTWLD